MLKLTKMTLTTRLGAEVELTIDEARDLHAQLAELFGPRQATHPILPLPIIIERDRWPPSPWRLYQPHWVGAPSSGDPLSAMPYVTCSTPSGLHTRYMGQRVD